MNTPIEFAFALTVALTIGVAAGLFHFGGLWWTVRRATNHHPSAAAFLISFVVRMAVTVGAFAVVLKLGILPLMTALAGFLISRTVLTRSLGATDMRTTTSTTSQEKHHA